MQPHNPYLSFVQQHAKLIETGKALPLGGFEKPPAPRKNFSDRSVMIFSPHPDDECIIGALPLRLQNECGWRVINVAVTQGSKKERQADRWMELEQACDYVGFELVPTRDGGLMQVTAKGRSDNPRQWNESVQIILGILEKFRPAGICFPHQADWNGTHIGTYLLVTDALKMLGPDFQCHTIESEFWAAMPNPNLAVESSVEDVATMIAALSFHVGEVRRNPYHLLLPGWMEDNVRRGGELVGGQGNPAPNFTFATLYRLRQWRNGGFVDSISGGKMLGQKDNPESLFST